MSGMTCWLSSRNFVRGGQNLLLCKFFCANFSIVFRPDFRGEELFEGGRGKLLEEGATPAPPPLEESQHVNKSTMPNTCNRLNKIFNSGKIYFQH